MCRRVEGLAYGGRSLADKYGWDYGAKKTVCTMCGAYGQSFYEVEGESVCLCVACREEMAQTSPEWEWLAK